MFILHINTLSHVAKKFTKLNQQTINQANKSIIIKHRHSYNREREEKNTCTIYALQTKITKKKLKNI